MRVVVAYNQHRHHGGGGDRHAADLVNLAAELGYQVAVFTKSSDALPQGLRGRLRAAASIFAAPGSVREFSALLDRFSPDLIHAAELFPLVSPYILPVARTRGIPVVLTPIDYRMTCPVVTHLYRGQICTRCCGGREHWAVLRNCRGNLAESASVAAYSAIVRKRALIRRNVDHYEAASKFVRDFLVRQAGIEEHRISVRNPLIELPADPVRDPSAGHYLGYAGRFTTEKGVQVALDAARMSSIPVRFARNDKSPVQVAVPPSMEIVTHTPEDLADFYRHARALIVPSIWYETFCIVAAEAMSLGIPVLASGHGAIGELVDNGVNGLHFVPGSAPDLAAKMRILWDDPSLCRALGAAAREKAVRQWGHANSVTALERMYRKVIEE